MPLGEYAFGISKIIDLGNMCDIDEVDCIYVNTYISSYMDPENYRGLLQHMSEKRSKPVVTWSYGPSSQAVRELGELTEAYDIPFYTTTNSAIRTLGYLARYAQWKGSRK